MNLLYFSIAAVNVVIAAVIFAKLEKECRTPSAGHAEPAIPPRMAAGLDLREALFREHDRRLAGEHHEPIERPECPTCRILLASTGSPDTEERV